MNRTLMTFGAVAAAAMLFAAPWAYAAVNETFTYPDGPLAGQGSWTGTPSPAVAVLSNQAKVTATVGANTATLPVSEGPIGGVITVTFDITPGTSDAEFIWNLHLQDGVGSSYGFFQGFGNSIRPRRVTGAGDVILDNKTLTGTTQIKVEIDTVATITRYYFNGALWTGGSGNPAPGALDWNGASGTLGRILIGNENRAATDPSVANGNSVLIDNLVVPEPAAAGLLALGAFLLRGRRRA